MSDSASIWASHNWMHTTGLPAPDAEPWMLMDTPLTRSTLDGLKNKSIVEMGERELRNTPNGKTYQHTYTTRQKRWEDNLMSVKSVPSHLIEGFAARPEARLYVVDLHSSTSPVAPVVEKVRDEHDVDIQLVGVDKSISEDYPGRRIETEVTDRVLRGVPAANLVSYDARLFGVAETKSLVENSPAERLIVNPDAEMVENALLRALDRVPTPTYGEWTRPDDDQHSLAEWDPKMATSVKPDVEGQATLADLV